jgi:hypothetical protein
MGIVERTHRSVLSLMRCGDEWKPWPERLAEAVYVYNNRAHAFLAYHTPREVMRGEIFPPHPSREGEQKLAKLVDLEVGDRALLYAEKKPKDLWPYDEVVVEKVLGENVVEIRKVGTNRVSTVNTVLLVKLETEDLEEDVEGPVMFGEFEPIHAGNEAVGADGPVTIPLTGGADGTDVQEADASQVMQTQAGMQGHGSRHDEVGSPRRGARNRIPPRRLIEEL